MTGSESGPIVQFPPAADLSAARPLADDLQAAIARAGGATIDASQVDRIATPCLQVLIAASRSGAIRLRKPSEAFSDAMRDLGLEHLLEEWSA